MATNLDRFNTDTDRLEVLARSLNELIVYEGDCRIKLSSDRKEKVGRKIVRKGVGAALFRAIADGLLEKERIDAGR